METKFAAYLESAKSKTVPAYVVQMWRESEREESGVFQTYKRPKNEKK